MNELKRFLKVLRAKNDESSKVMAEKLGISRYYLSTIENGRTKMLFSFVEKVKDNYNLLDHECEFLEMLLIESMNEIRIPLSKVTDETKKRLLIAIYMELKNADINKLIKIKEFLSETNETNR